MKDAAVEPYRFNVAFNTTTWTWISDVTSLVQSFYHTGKLPSNLKHVYIIVFIPKMTPYTPLDFKPISLCNVIHKIISKN